MIDFFKRIYNSRFIQAYIRFVQKILVTFFLTILYFLGYTIIYIYAIIFKRKLIFGTKGRSETYWIEAKDYHIDKETGLQQS
jgi:hypothetical protein